MATKTTERSRSNVPQMSASLNPGPDGRADHCHRETGGWGLCPLDLGRDHRFLSDVAVQKQFRVREQGRDAIEAAKGYERTVESVPKGRRNDQGRVRRKRVRHERPHHFAGGRSPYVCASWPTL